MECDGYSQYEKKPGRDWKLFSSSKDRKDGK